MGRIGLATRLLQDLSRARRCLRSSPPPFREFAVLRREYCSSSSHRSSRLPTLTCKSSNWVSFFTVLSISDFVIVTASPRRSWAMAFVVTGPLVSRDKIAASRAPISIVVCVTSGAVWGISQVCYVRENISGKIRPS